MFSYKIILPSAALSACKSVAQSCSGPKTEVLKIPGPLIVNESEIYFLLLSLHAPLIEQCRMKQMNVADINLPPTLLLSVRIIRWKQGLEQLVGNSLIHKFCWWAWHFNQTCTSLKVTTVENCVFIKVTSNMISAHWLKFWETEFLTFKLSSSACV